MYDLQYIYHLNYNREILQDIYNWSTQQRRNSLPGGNLNAGSTVFSEAMANFIEQVNILLLPDIFYTLKHQKNISIRNIYGGFENYNVYLENIYRYFFPEIKNIRLYKNATP